MSKDSSDDDIQIPIKTAVEHVKSMSFKSLAGAVFGYCAGTFAKQMSQQIIWYSGLSCTMLGVLAW